MHARTREPATINRSEKWHDSFRSVCSPTQLTGRQLVCVLVSTEDKGFARPRVIRECNGEQSAENSRPQTESSRNRCRGAGCARWKNAFHRLLANLRSQDSQCSSPSVKSSVNCDKSRFQREGLFAAANGFVQPAVFLICVTAVENIAAWSADDKDDDDDDDGDMTSSRPDSEKDDSVQRTCLKGVENVLVGRGSEIDEAKEEIPNAWSELRAPLPRR